MIKKIAFILFVVLLLGLLIDCNIKLVLKTVELSLKRTEVDSLKKTIYNVQYQYGQTLANQHCHSCHRFRYATDNFLEGVIQNLGADYVSLYLTKQDSLIRNGDEHALLVKRIYGNMGNSHNFKLNKSELAGLIEYMK
jgi:mono/diheme cytochrome c family protein